MISFLLATLPTVADFSSSVRTEAPRDTSPEFPSLIAPENFAADDDAHVVGRCLQAADEASRLQAFGVLLARHRNRVLDLSWQMLGSRDDAEDAAQETFLLVFRGVPNFRGDAQFGTWIYRIALNVCLGRKRRAKTCQEWSDEFAPLADRSGASDAAAHAEMRLHVAQTLDRLSPILRAVLVLREIHDLTYGEIARVLDVPVGTVRSRLSEARRRFIALWSSE